MSQRLPCAHCNRLTRQSVRFPMRGESYRVPACSTHKQAQRDTLATWITPEFRLLVAIHGGVAALMS
jgi:hypothetical protein